MLKRNISVVVVGMMLGAQVGLAAASESAAPLGAEAIVAKTEPSVKSTYQSAHAGSVTVSRAAPMPSNDSQIVANGEPRVLSTFEERHSNRVAASSRVAIPLGAQAIREQGEPSVQATYLQRHAGSDSAE